MIYYILQKYIIFRLTRIQKYNLIHKNKINFIEQPKENIIILYNKMKNKTCKYNKQNKNKTQKNKNRGGKYKKNKSSSSSLYLSPNKKSDLFLKVEKLFTDELYRKSDIYDKYAKKNKNPFSTNFNFCCTDEDERDMIIMGDMIKTHPKYKSLGYREIYLVLIYVYYSLRYNEQTEDWLRMSFLKYHMTQPNFNKAKELYIDITVRDIMVNGENLSVKIRRFIMGLDNVSPISSISL
jgi:hypothetical protein